MRDLCMSLVGEEDEERGLRQVMKGREIDGEDEQ